MKELLTKLTQVQSELKAPKGQRNNFGNYNYRNAEDILEALKPLLNEKGLSLIMQDEVTQIGDRYYVKASVTLYDNATGQHIVNQAFAREEETKKGMDGSQITGASSSYARKYALNGMFAIDDTKDSDSTNTHGKEETKATQPLVQKPKEVKVDEVKPAPTLTQSELNEEAVELIIVNNLAAIKTQEDLDKVLAKYGNKLSKKAKAMLDYKQTLFNKENK